VKQGLDKEFSSDFKKYFAGFKKCYTFAAPFRKINGNNSSLFDKTDERQH
jgi:hypothetical protein